MSVGCTDLASCGRHCERDVSDGGPDIVLSLSYPLSCDPVIVLSCPVLSCMHYYKTAPAFPVVRAPFYLSL